MASSEQLRTWLESDASELVATVVSDIQRHVRLLQTSGDSFYGYAVLPGDYFSQQDSASLAVAFNRESDVAADNSTEPYYRYCVDEWENMIHEGFETTNSILESRLARFGELHSGASDSCQPDEYEIAFVTGTNRAIIEALLELKRNRTFEDEIYLSIWFSDSDSDIMNEAVKALNSDQVYREYAAEFQ